MLDFEKISLGLKLIIDKYYNKYGEGSCQHAFNTSFCLKNKYNDMFFEKDSVLYIYRDGISNNDERVYLFPMCDKNDKVKVKNAIENIISDAHYYNKKFKFQTITKSSKDLLIDLFGDRFLIEDCRDFYEYIYNVEDIANLPGSQYQSKRNIINKLYNIYTDVAVKMIDNNDQDEMRKLYLKWLDSRTNIDEHIVNNEIKEFDVAMNNYEELELIGVCVYIDKKLVGFNFGSIISNETYDGMIQKGDANYAGIYELLNRETAKMLINKIKYMNFEEDLGVEGLRKAKLMYRPEYLLEKYIVKEKEY